jgi:hypothetical protein
VTADVTTSANPSLLSEPAATRRSRRDCALALLVDIAHRCACVAIFTAIAAPLAIGAGFSATALLLITAAAALLCGSTGTLLWRTKFAPARRREGRGLVILAIVLLIWSGLWSLGRMQRVALRAGASASQSLRNVLTSYGR